MKAKSHNDLYDIMTISAIILYGNTRTISSWTVGNFTSFLFLFEFLLSFHVPTEYYPSNIFMFENIFLLLS